MCPLPAVHGLQYMDLSVQRNAYAAVTKPFRNDLDIYSGFQQSCRRSMAHIVDAELPVDTAAISRSCLKSCPEKELGLRGLPFKVCDTNRSFAL